MPLPNDASSRSDPASRDDPTTALVEVGAGMAVLFADRPPSEMELIPFSMMSTETTKRLTDRLAIGAGLVNTGVQGVQGALPAQGLVLARTPDAGGAQDRGSGAVRGLEPGRPHRGPRFLARHTVGSGDQCAGRHPAVLARARSRAPEPADAVGLRLPPG